MNQFSTNRGFPAGNPIANALVIVVGTLVIAASLVLGFFAFIALSTILMILAAIVGVRMWWFKRKFQQSGAGASTAETRRADGVIEGEYRVVVEDQDGDEGK